MNSEAPVDSSFKQDLEPPAWPLQAHENELSKLLELVESLYFLISITSLLFKFLLLIFRGFYSIGGGASKKSTF